MRFRKPTLYKKRKTRNKRIKTRRKMRHYRGGGGLNISQIETYISNVKDQINKYEKNIEHYKLLDKLRKELDANFKTINSNSFLNKTIRSANSLVGRPGTNELHQKKMDKIAQINAQIHDNPVQPIQDFDTLIRTMWSSAFNAPDNTEVLTEEDNTLKEKELKDKVLKTYRDAMYVKSILDTYQGEAKYYTSTHEFDGAPKKVTLTLDENPYSRGRGEYN